MKAIEVIKFPFHVDCYPIWPKKPKIITHESPFFGFRKIETPSQKGPFRLRVPILDILLNWILPTKICSVNCVPLTSQTNMTFRFDSKFIINMEWSVSSFFNNEYRRLEKSNDIYLLIPRQIFEYFPIHLAFNENKPEIIKWLVEKYLFDTKSPKNNYS